MLHVTQSLYVATQENLLVYEPECIIPGGSIGAVQVSYKGINFFSLCNFSPYQLF